MSFQSNPPIVVTNTLPKHIIERLFWDFGMGLSVVLPRTEQSTLYVGISPWAKFKFSETSPYVYTFETKSEYFLTPIYNINERDKQIHSLILTALADFNDLFSLADNIKPSLKSHVFFEPVDFKEACEAIKKSIFINNPN